MDFIFDFFEAEFVLTGIEIIFLVFISMILSYILLFLKLLANYSRIVGDE